MTVRKLAPDSAAPALYQCLFGWWCSKWCVNARERIRALAASPFSSKRAGAAEEREPLVV